MEILDTNWTTFFSLSNCTIFWGHPVVAYNYTYKFYNSLDNKVFGSGSQTLRLEAKKYSMARVVGFTRLNNRDGRTPTKMLFLCW